MILKTILGGVNLDLCKFSYHIFLFLVVQKKKMVWFMKPFLHVRANSILIKTECKLLLFSINLQKLFMQFDNLVLFVSKYHENVFHLSVVILRCVVFQNPFLI